MIVAVLCIARREGHARTKNSLRLISVSFPKPNISHPRRHPVRPSVPFFFFLRNSSIVIAIFPVLPYRFLSIARLLLIVISLFLSFHSSLLFFWVRSTRSRSIPPKLSKSWPRNGIRRYVRQRTRRWHHYGVHRNK